ncbi:MAG TPA: hypothetical protein VMA77_23810 [Solirubrobacteraceae bacterium]|nr:hypothetical protein [Solirubrobacteraceae bacterium]
MAFTHFAQAFAAVAPYEYPPPTATEPVSVIVAPIVIGVPEAVDDDAGVDEAGAAEDEAAGADAVPDPLLPQAARATEDTPHSATAMSSVSLRLTLRPSEYNTTPPKFLRTRAEGRQWLPQDVRT